MTFGKPVHTHICKDCGKPVTCPDGSCQAGFVHSNCPKKK